jgi:hypothetical protein
MGPAGTLIPWLEYNATDLTVWNNGKGNIQTNTSFGENAGKSNLGGFQNTAFGFNALRLNETGESNVAIGAGTLDANKYGHSNVAIGVNVLAAGTDVGNNIGIGNGALFNTTSISNVAIGLSSLTTITGGQGNTAIGYWSGRFAGGASTKNVYIGYSAGPATTTTESNKLYIANSPGNPLIGGDFSAGIVTINDILNLRPRVSAPASPVDGMIAVYGVGAAQHIYCRLNGAWVQLD